MNTTEHIYHIIKSLPKQEQGHLYAMLKKDLDKTLCQNPQSKEHKKQPLITKDKARYDILKRFNQL